MSRPRVNRPNPPTMAGTYTDADPEIQPQRDRKTPESQPEP
jgi:hypothetical protein